MLLRSKLNRLFVFSVIGLLLSVPCSLARSINIDTKSSYRKLSHKRLNSGEVIVGLKTIGDRKFVTGKIWIPYPVEKVWPILVNPYEFKSNISPGMKDLKVLTDKEDLSVLKITAKYPIPLPIPPISYTVKSRYSHNSKGSSVEFERVSGSLKDFHGHWYAKSICNGKKTELLYSMYIDPGFYVPQWIIRRGVSGELPKTLTSLRTRINRIYSREALPVKRTITASAVLHGKHRRKHL